MKITYNWLKDFVDIKIPAKELAAKLTMAGLEVVALEEKAGDFVLEIEITPNRPDWLSVLGVAREIAAITNTKLKIQNPKGKVRSAKGNFKIEIEDKKDCPLYSARIIRNVRVAPSPEWLRKRLELIGCRSVNNVVDITNYVLFELGEPLHAFDLDKLSQDKIIVRRAKDSEKLLAIDEEERNLKSKVLVIADRNKPVAIAGVMGGKETEVTTSTRNVLLEAAIFDPVVVRRGRQALGLQSEASYRFERGVDLTIVEKASLRAAQLIQEICGGGDILFLSSGLTKPKEIRVDLDTVYVAKILGVKITRPKIKQILCGLGFKVRQKSKEVFKVGVPSFRQDIKLQVDLIEEVARVFGYDNIPASQPAVKPEITVREKRDLVSAIKAILVGLGVNEVATYSLLDKAVLNNLDLNLTKPIEILNPLSQDQEILRPTLIPGLGRAVSFNINQKQDYVSIFEIGNIFLGETKPKEELVLGLALSGTNSFLLEQGLVKDEAGLLNLKGILETIFLRLGIQGYEFNNQGALNCAIRIQNEKVGLMLGLSPKALEGLNIKNREVFALEVSLDKLFSFVRPDKKFTPLPKYPGITRDISFVLKDDLSVKDILLALRQKGQPLLNDIRITDYYKGKQIPAGFRGLTLSCFYSSNERTLTEKEIQPIQDLLCGTLMQTFGVKMR
ncbi:MAG: phenylalanine--tRNA ligase subunit beta [Candidatus Omnitrophica bacterium]|nr:phenylalanine--tRNA ligase subunit beta [Candidatus Omnitrophota bacterium]